MKIFVRALCLLAATRGLVLAETPAPSFSTNYMDRSVDPSVNFYQFACGTWRKDNPVPADKARWGAFDELAQRNWELLHGLVVTASADASAPAHSPTREVGDFFASAMDTNRIEQLGFEPLQEDFTRIEAVLST